MMELVFALAVGVLTASGVWLLLRPRTFQVIIGLSLLSYAVNLFIFGMGRLRVGAPPVLESTEAVDPALFADPLPQALVLTAIVITLAVTSFLLALIHRTWTLEREDDLTEDVEDRSLRHRLARGEQEDEEELDTTGCENVADTDPDDDDGRSTEAGPDPAGDGHRAPAASGTGASGEDAR